MEKRRNLGKESPLDYKPELFEDLRVAWGAFSALHDKRQVNMAGAQAFTIMDIGMWLDIHGYDGADRIELLEQISFIDSCWLEKERARMKAESDRKKRKAKRNRKGK